MNKLHAAVCAATAVLLLSASASATSVPAVKDPRPADRVVDETNTLNGLDLMAINEVAKAGDPVGELMVVVVSSTDGMIARNWATDLFNRFALDTKKRNKGILLMAALGDRKAEIVLGDGWPDDTTQITDDIMQNEIVARMKRGATRTALVEGARALSTRLLQDPKAVLEATARKAEEEAIRALAVKITDPRKVPGALDKPRVLSKADQKALAKVRATAKPDMTLAVVVLQGIQRDAGAIAEALLEQYPLDGERGRGVLVVLFADTNILKVVAEPGFPAEYLDQRRTPALRAYAQALANDVRMGTALVDLVRALAVLGAELPAWQEANARAEAEAAARKAAEWEEKLRVEREAASRAASVAAEAAFAREQSTAKDRTVFAGGGAALLGIAAGARLFLRHRRRKCPQCNTKMDRLDEDAEDDHLALSEQREEELGSVNYDIWLCPECSTTVKTRWAAILTGYSTCPRCSAKTVATSSRTVSAATYTSTGTAEVTRSCKACSFHATERRTIPRKQQSSSSSGSRSSSSSSSGSRSSGGSSSGRGSSGSW